jgi:hypothetical protein
MRFYKHANSRTMNDGRRFPESFRLIRPFRKHLEGVPYAFEENRGVACKNAHASQSDRLFRLATRTMLAANLSLWTAGVGSCANYRDGESAPYLDITAGIR